MELSLVEMFFGDDSPNSGFNQKCVHGNLVDGHSVYCHNDDCPYRKCRRTWYTGGEEKDEDCEFYSPNPDFKEEQK